MLRIGVDARPLNYPYSGIGQYLQALLEVLLPATRNEVRWHFYSDRPLPTHLPWHDSVLRSGANSSRLLSTLFAQRWFGHWGGKDQLDLFWSPRHQLPLNLPPAIRSVVTLHDLVFRSHPQTMTTAGRILEQLLTPPSLKRASAIITTSKFVLRELDNYSSALAAKASAIPLSSNIADIKAGLDEMQLPQTPYILFCGSSEPRKNLDRLLRSFAGLKAGLTPPPQRLVIVSGSGWKNATTNALMEQYKAFVEVRSDVTEGQKAALMRAADFLVLPSLTEGFGIPLVEAQKLGLPMLTSHTGAMPEIAGEAAIYVDPYDETAISRALKALCSNSNLRADLGRTALEQAASFNWQRSAIETMGALQRAAT